MGLKIYQSIDSNIFEVVHEYLQGGRISFNGFGSPGGLTNNNAETYWRWGSCLSHIPTHLLCKLVLRTGLPVLQVIFFTKKPDSLEKSKHQCKFSRDSPISKLGKIIPILKSGKLLPKGSSYRPIILISSLQIISMAFMRTLVPLCSL